MKVTRIDLEGRPGRYATISRKAGSDVIEVTILVPEIPNGRTHHVKADCREDVFSMAECLIVQLEKTKGTNSMVHDYFRELERFMD